MRLEDFTNELKKTPMTNGFAEQIDILISRYGDEYIDVAESILDMFESLKLDSVKTARRYIFDYLKQLDYFLKNGDYGHTDYDEIRNQIYDNKETMLDTYMPGLLLSYAYTTILYEKNHLFLTAFLPRVANGTQGIEIGFGEGFYIWELLKNKPGSKVFGFDVSEHAVSFATNFLKIAGVSESHFILKQGNVFEGIPVENGSMDFATFAEVIEHIPNPEIGLQEVVRMLRPGGVLYLTTVINSNHMDHISNFESPKIVEWMLEDSGMRIVAKNIYHMTDDFPNSSDISIGLAFVAEKK